MKSWKDQLKDLKRVLGKTATEEERNEKLDEVDFEPPFKLPGYRPEVRKALPEQIAQVIAYIRRSKKPV